ncbi:MAG: two pore domain potassium channel family protein [Parvularculaceae bacterium]|nr:two pore domain potassium channel family protein [Parvularculaceae bacterium]
MPFGLIGNQLAISGFAVLASIVIHGLIIISLREFAKAGSTQGGFRSDVIDVFKLSVVGLGLILAHALSVAVWAAIFLFTAVSGDLEDALYFGLTTYTTLGFGDILAPQPWRLLPGFASLNGLLMFGLSAAVLVDAAARLRRQHG